MSLYNSIILGLIQGLTEFLPISSSGHLVFLPWLLGWGKHPLVFDIAVHLATLFAIFIYFRREWIAILHGGFLSIKERTLEGPGERRLFWYIVTASIPAIAFGAIVADKAESSFRSPILVGLMLGLFGLILYFSQIIGKKDKSLKRITLRSSLLIGISQMLAIIPGVSRSGVTMSMAMILGFDRESSARFSFLLAAPVILAATVYHIKGLNEFLASNVFLAGFVASFLSSMLAIHFLLKYVKRHPFTVFVIYRLVISAIILIALF
jgi:undecaprenyl-diphosphatase